MQFDLDLTLETLSRTPQVLERLLRDLDDEWIRANQGPETWSPFDIVGHFIHGERTDWVPRARIILQEGTSRTFEPFDRFAQYEASRLGSDRWDSHRDMMLRTAMLDSGLVPYEEFGIFTGPGINFEKVYNQAFNVGRNEDNFQIR